MPRYSYQCEPCDEYYEITHGMKESVDLHCIQCGESLSKIPSIPLGIKAKTTEKRTGNVVKSYIEDSKSDLKNQKKDLQDKR